MEFVGLDGCRAGWFYFGLSDSGEQAFGIARDVPELAAVGARAKLALVDIPIGLKEAGTAERLCDKEARRILGKPRGASVFRAPARPTLAATSFENASRQNYALTGKHLSRQAWSISDKIRQIDQLLREYRDLRGVFREMHPEVCFWILNRGRATVNGKKCAAGRQERIDILTRYLPETRSMVFDAASSYRRDEVGWDDILDALAGAVTARLGHQRLRALPETPERDARGFPMEIVFAAV